MNKKILIGSGLVLVVLVLVFVLRGKDKVVDQQTSTTHHDWTPTYEVSPKYKPYDKGLLLETMKAVYESNFNDISMERDLSNLLGRAPENTLYFNIRRNFRPDSLELNALQDFANRGNDVFIAAEQFSSEDLDRWFEVEYQDIDDDLEADDEGIDDTEPWQDQWEWSEEQGTWVEIEKIEEPDTFWSSFYTSSTSRSLHEARGWKTGAWEDFVGSIGTSRVHGFLANKPDSVSCAPKTVGGNVWIKDWKYFNVDQISEYAFNSDSIVPIAYIRRDFKTSTNYPVCIKIKAGKGNVYLMTCPIMFSNFFLKDSSHFKFISSMLGSIRAEEVYWDEMTRYKYNEAEYDHSETYFRFLLNNSALSKAFYFTLLIAFLYLILSIKRRQRSIPILDQNENTSLAYSNSIARLYYLNPNHKLILDKKRLHFQSFINKRYGLMYFDDDDFLERLAQKSGVKVKYIRKLYNSYKLADKQSVVHEYLLLQVANLQEHFYLNCK
jgi:hypothetical protein